MTLAANLAALARRLVGTSANNLVALDGAAKLPPVDGSQLSGIGRKLISTANISAAASADIVLPSGYSKFEVELIGHTGSNYMQIQVRQTGAGSVLSGATDYKGVSQVRSSGVVTYDGSAGTSSFRLSPSVADWKDLILELDNLTGFIKSNSWLPANEMDAVGRVQTAGPYDLLRLTPSTGTLTCTCKLFGYKVAS